MDNIPSRKDIKGWDTLLKILHLLDVDHEAKDSWSMLGYRIWRAGFNLLSDNEVRQRYKGIAKFVHPDCRVSWTNPLDIKKADEFSAKLSAAREECLLSLQDCMELHIRVPAQTEAGAKMAGVGRPPLGSLRHQIP